MRLTSTARRSTSNVRRFTAEPFGSKTLGSADSGIALGYHDQRTSFPARFDPSAAFLRDVRRVGLDSVELSQVISQGTRARRWDGCLILQDRFLGIEVELDPSGTIGISARRIS
jgi:hypothetical protein